MSGKHRYPQFEPFLVRAIEGNGLADFVGRFESHIAATAELWCGFLFDPDTEHLSHAMLEQMQRVRPSRKMPALEGWDLFEIMCLDFLLQKDPSTPWSRRWLTRHRG